MYTAQGFEFDYVGVIFGLDLRNDMDEQRWVGQKENSHDNSVKRSGDKFTDLVKNTYRVLLTRGMKGCYVYFMDKDNERFVRSRMETKKGHNDTCLNGLFKVLTRPSLKSLDSVSYLRGHFMRAKSQRAE